MKLIVSVLIVINLTTLNFTLSQCSVSINNDDTITVCSGFNADLNASLVSPGSYIAYVDFNGGSSLPAGWTSNMTVVGSQVCVPSPTGTDYFWTNDGSTTPRYIQTDTLNLLEETDIIFDIRYAIQGQGTPCEGPDQEDEGVQLEYSIDLGNIWFPITYINPVGIQQDSVFIFPGGQYTVNGPTPYTFWNTFSVDLPLAAMTDSTLIRWIQYEGSGSSFDSFGLDEIKIQSSNNFVFNWSTGAMDTASVTINTLVDTIIYVNVYDTLGAFLCSDTVWINIDTAQAGFDNGVDLIPGYLFAGTNNSIIIDGYNSGCTMTNGVITLYLLDTLTSFVSSVPPPDNQIGNNYVQWNYSGLGQGQPHFINYVILDIDTAAQVGDTLYWDLYIEDITGDMDVQNNIRNYEIPIATSLDPNDKNVYPIGDCPEHYIPNDQRLTYTIRFQNTGTADAQTVRVLDPISGNLNLNSLNVVAASHPYTLTYIGNNTAQFYFDQIMLPPVSVDSIGSIGYIIFEIDQLQGLSNGTLLNNHAEIYFDYNAPIVTQTVFNTVSDGFHLNVIDTLEFTIIDSIVVNGVTYDSTGTYQQFLGETICDSVLIIIINESSLSVKDINSNDFIGVYPNPTDNILNITQKVDIAILFDAIGRVVLTEEYTDQLNLGDLETGHYILKMEAGETVVQKHLLKK